MEKYASDFNIDEIFNSILMDTNLNKDIVNKISKNLGLVFLPGQNDGNVCFANNNSELRDDFKQVFTSLDLSNYIYAVLHSTTCRNKYKESLKKDFPRVPYPKKTDNFWKLVELGGQLRKTPLLESAKTRLMKEIDQYLFKLNS